MRKFKKLFAGAAIASAMVLSSVGINVAYAYPTDPIQLVVPFKPGGGADRTFRLFAPYLSEVTALFIFWLYNIYGVIIYNWRNSSSYCSYVELFLARAKTFYFNACTCTSCTTWSQNHNARIFRFRFCAIYFRDVPCHLRWYDWHLLRRYDYV